MFLQLSPSLKHKRLRIVSLKFFRVRQHPLFNMKTGFVSLFECLEISFHFFIAAAGQQLWFGNGKMSIYSPPWVLDFGAFTWISQDLPLKLMSCHRSVVAKSTFVIVLLSNSPILKDPKNAMQLTVQKICLLSAVQFVSEISLPKIFRRGNVMIFLLCFLLGVYNVKFSAPRNISLIVKL